MSTDPVISIVTPMHDSAATVAATLDSVLAQSVAEWEAVVVDDGSTDASARIVQEYVGGDPRVRLLPNYNGKGPAGARNTGIEAARGRYIAFLDSDDLWQPYKLEKQIAFMQETGAALSFTAYEIFENDPARPLRVRGALSEVAYEDLLDRNHIGCLTAMYDTEQVGKVYMPDIRMRQDWGLWLRIVKASGKPAIGLNEPLSMLRLRPGSLSRNKLVALWYNYRLLHDFEGIGALDAATRVLKGGLMAVRGH